MGPGDWTLQAPLSTEPSHQPSTLSFSINFTQWKRRGRFYLLQNYGKTISLREHQKKTALLFKNLQKSIITYKQAMFSRKWTEWYSTSQWDLALVCKPYSDQPELDTCKVAHSNIKAPRTSQLSKEQHLGNASFAFVKNLTAGSKEKTVSKPATWSLLWMLCMKAPSSTAKSAQLASC